MNLSTRNHSNFYNTSSYNEKVLHQLDNKFKKMNDSDSLIVMDDQASDSFYENEVREAAKKLQSKCDDQDDFKKYLTNLDDSTSSESDTEEPEAIQKNYYDDLNWSLHLSSSDSDGSFIEVAERSQMPLLERESTPKIENSSGNQADGIKATEKALFADLDMSDSGSDSSGSDSDSSGSDSDDEDGSFISVKDDNTNKDHSERVIEVFVERKFVPEKNLKKVEQPQQKKSTKSVAEKPQAVYQVHQTEDFEAEQRKKLIEEARKKREAEFDKILSAKTIYAQQRMKMKLHSQNDINSSGRKFSMKNRVEFFEHLRKMELRDLNKENEPPAKKRSTSRN